MIASKKHDCLIDFNDQVEIGRTYFMDAENTSCRHRSNLLWKFFFSFLPDERGTYGPSYIQAIAISKELRAEGYVS